MLVFSFKFKTKAAVIFNNQPTPPDFHRFGIADR